MAEGEPEKQENQYAPIRSELAFKSVGCETDSDNTSLSSLPCGRAAKAQGGDGETGRGPGDSQEGVERVSSIAGYTDWGLIGMWFMGEIGDGDGRN